MGLFDIIGEAPPEQFDTAEALIQSFRAQAPCSRCSLSEVNQNNKGFIHRGNLNARIAVLTDSPFAEDIAGESVFCGPGRYAWEKIIKTLNTPEKGKNLPYRPLSDEDFFMTFIMQCRTAKDVVMKKRKKGKKNVFIVDPENANKQDVLTCFNLHTWPVLQMLPNLQVIIATGKIAIQMILREEYMHDRHVGNFFLSEFFPKVPVFCLDSLRMYDIASDFKMTELREDLDFFRYKYLETGRVMKVHSYYQDCRSRGIEVSLNQNI